MDKSVLYAAHASARARLPRKNLRILDAAVFWPLSTDPLFPLVGTFPFPSSDHRLVWVDVRIPGLGDDDDD